MFSYYQKKIVLSENIMSCLRTGSFSWTSESTTDCALMVTEDGFLFVVPVPFN